MNVYEAKTYCAFVLACLDGAREAGKKGAARRLALELKCHSTYVSQVLRGKADLSPDQAVRFCAYFKLGAEQTDFFLDLLARDRAATKETKAHYQKRLDRRLAELSDMKKRWGIAESLTAEQESRYYGSWIPQAVHLYCQLPGPHDAARMATALAVPEERIAKVLRDLAELGFVEKTSAGWVSRRDSVHLGKDSALIGRYHANWRLKTIADLTAQGGAFGTHYSAVVSMSAKTAKELQELILKHLEAARDAIIPSPSEGLYVHSLDFYPLVAAPERVKLSESAKKREESSR